MRVITPIDITNDMLTSSISEPDASQGEEVWDNDYNSAKYAPSSGCRSLASNLTTDYVLWWISTGVRIAIYESGIFQENKTLSTNLVPNDAVYYDGYVFFTVGTDSISAYNISTDTDTSKSVNSDPDSSVVFDGICVVDDVFYLYDYENKKIKTYSLDLDAGGFNYISTVKEVELSRFTKLCESENGGIIAMYGNSVSTYSVAFDLISETSLEFGDSESSSQSGLSNNGSGLVAYNKSDGYVRNYDYDFLYSGNYQVGDQVISTDTHLIYQCVTDTTDDPIIGAALTVPSWIEVSATNKWRMFDYVINTKSTLDGGISLSPGEQCTNIGFFGLSGVKYVAVNVYENDITGDLIYSETQALAIEMPFDDIDSNETLYSSKALFDNLPDHESPFISITFNDATGYESNVHDYSDIILTSEDYLADANGDYYADLLTADGSTFNTATYPGLYSALGGDTLIDLTDQQPTGSPNVYKYVADYTGDSSSVEIGDIVIGNARTMGVVVHNTSTSRTSYDTVDTDDFGNETITSRPSAEYTTFELVVFPKYANYVERILKDSLNKPRVYVGDKQNDEKLFTFGYYERSPISYDSPTLCTTTLKVRGLV